MRGATPTDADAVKRATFQSTRPMRGATWRHDGNRGAVQCFNPRAPCGARHGRGTVYFDGDWFQSTRPMRGATAAFATDDDANHVSIHAPHAGRDPVHLQDLASLPVSIHAPHAGRDGLDAMADRFVGVSIHAPHAGRDRGR